MYVFAEKMIQLYNRLQDELSKNIFWARLQYEAEPDMDRAVQLCEIGCGTSEGPHMTWREQFASAAANGKRIVLYGAGDFGIMFAKTLFSSQGDFFAFCDQKKAGETVMGKPVLSPQEIINCPEQYAVIITTGLYYQEILQILLKNGFPAASILTCGSFNRENTEERCYREFPELFRPGTAIVDGGCFDGADTVRFSKWHKYSKIYAFEPDADNYQRAKANIAATDIPNVTLVQAGLSCVSGKSTFTGSLGSGSHLLDSTERKYNVLQSELSTPNTTVQVYALDDLADTEIGLIKMDIEGAEFDALHGAERTIRRDKPQMAICVYHRQGDMLAIMEYLQSLVPEYRFWLRHYGPLGGDTVLYAAV